MNLRNEFEKIEHLDTFKILTFYDLNKEQIHGLEKEMTTIEFIRLLTTIIENLFKNKRFAEVVNESKYILELSKKIHNDNEIMDFIYRNTYFIANSYFSLKVYELSLLYFETLNLMHPPNENIEKVVLQVKKNIKSKNLNLFFLAGLILLIIYLFIMNSFNFWFRVPILFLSIFSFLFKDIYCFFLFKNIRNKGKLKFESL